MAEIVIVGSNNSDEPKDYSKGYLTIPFEGDQFKNFISSLLGKPQSIERHVSGLFEIHMSDIQNFFELVNQRVLQQNKGQLVQFIANIYFSDNSSVQLGGFEELITYKELKPIVSKSIRLTWVYLIQFPGKSYPEKQSIELRISVSSNIDHEDRMYGFVRPSRSGLFGIRIDHTERSWGFDMENVLFTQISSLIKKDSQLKKLVRDNKNNISSFFSLGVFFTCLIGSFLTADSFIDNQIFQIKNFTTQKNLTIDEKINFLLSYIASGSAAKFYFYVVLFLVLAAIASVSLSIWISAEAEKHFDSSFLILTKRAKEQKDETLRRQRNNWVIFLLSLIGSIVVGIISNYIFKILVE